MLVEKKSLRRFLLVYTLSTLFLLGVGSFFYYKMSYQALMDKHALLMKKELESFISDNQKKHFLRTSKSLDYKGMPVAVYVDKVFKKGNFKPENVHLEREHYVEEAKLYYIITEHKRWGELHFVTYTDIKGEIESLQRSIVIFLFLSTLFILFIASVLGKIFVRPMKETIESLENFIADATHEINTPISNILINIEMAKELYPELKTTEECQKIEKSAFRISKLFKDLSFVRLNHQPKREIEVLDAASVLEERVAFFGAFIKNKALRLETHIEKKVLSMDKEELIRIIDNLLSNAIKYSPQGGRLSVRLNASLEVRNEGEIEDTKSIMKKYSRENRSEGGFGLGLYIIQKICERYGFDFSIETKEDEVIAKVCFSNVQ